MKAVGGSFSEWVAGFPTPPIQSDKRQLATVLLVDDIKTNLVLLESALGRGYRLLTASSGDQALQLAATQSPDLMLLDVMMPGMNGFETARALRRMPALREVPIIFVTAHTDDDAQVHGLELGAVDFIIKPFSLAVLRLRVEAVIERQRLRADAARHQGELATLLARQAQALGLLESVFNASIDALLVTDSGFRLLKANEQARPLFGFGADIGIEGLDLHGTLRRLEDGTMLTPETLVHAVAPTECLLRTRGNRDVPVAIICRSFPYRPGELGYLLSVRDISARLLLEAEKRSASSRLHEAQLELEAARQRELETGAAIQQRLLFGHPPAGQDSFAFAYYNQASQGVAGDFYTFTRLNEDCVEILTGDVMGKGVAAALIAASILSAYRKCQSELMADQEGEIPAPAALVNAMHAMATPELVRLDSFVTLSLLRLDRRNSVACWVNAGHTPTLLAQAGSASVVELEGDNLPLGVFEHEVYGERTVRLDSGDMLLLYSDGMSESINPAGLEYGAQRIAHILALGASAAMSPAAVLSSLRRDLLAHSGQIGGRDDCTAIVVQVAGECSVNHGASRQVRQLELPRNAQKLHLLRQAIEGFVSDQLEEFVHSLTLAVYEAATNILRHARALLPEAPISVLLERNGHEVWVSLVHEGEPFVPQHDPCPDFTGGSEGGFGLYIMQRSVDRIEYGRPMPGLASITLFKRLPVASD